MPVRSVKSSRLVPIVIRKPSYGDGTKGCFVISLADAVSSSEVFDWVQTAELEYRRAIERWSKRVVRIRLNKSDPTERWKLAEDITSFLSVLEKKWNLQIVNVLPAFSSDLGISERALELMLKFRRRFALTDVEKSGIRWSKFQEMVDIRNDAKMRQCFKMAVRRELKTDGDIRRFKRKANSMPR